MAKEKIKTKNIIQKNAGYIISNPEHSTANDNLQLQEIKYEKLKLKSIFNKKKDWDISW